MGPHGEPLTGLHAPGHHLVPRAGTPSLPPAPGLYKWPATVYWPLVRDDPTMGAGAGLMGAGTGGGDAGAGADGPRHAMDHRSQRIPEGPPSRGWRRGRGARGPPPPPPPHTHGPCQLANPSAGQSSLLSPFLKSQQLSSCVSEPQRFAARRTCCLRSHERVCQLRCTVFALCRQLSAAGSNPECLICREACRRHTPRASGKVFV